MARYFLVGLTLAVASISGCSSDSGSDVTDGGAEVDAVTPDAGPADAEIPDVGSCGCTFGYHHGCSADELCMAAHGGETVCTRAEPNGGCIRTSSGSAWAPCDAQCTPVEPAVSPCAREDNSSVEGTIRLWGDAIDHAAMANSVTGWEHITPADLSAARSAPISAECHDFLAWTVLGVMELCRGRSTVQHFEPWEGVEQILFKHLRDPEDLCQIGAGSTCLGVLEDGLSIGTPVVARVDNILTVCSVAALPYDSPCRGPDAQDCLKRRLATIITALYR